ncbi:MAG: VTT domain-containing protein [Dehalococcoidales bacterium]|nr:VTT domain-containing protein [Dehalococcoidales bacterium]
MTVFKDAKDSLTKPGSQIHWVRLVITIVGLIVLSFGFAFVLQRTIARFNLPLYDLAYLAYAVVFATTLIANLTIIAPVPLAVVVMITAATKWNPALVALAASIGGTIGELSGYYAGYIGQKMVISENVIGYKHVEGWIKKYGVWAIMVLAFQPIVPFDIGGLVAGAARMPLHLFLPALFAGKFPKYLLLTWVGAGVIHFLPFFSS